MASSSLARSSGGPTVASVTRWMPPGTWRYWAWKTSPRRASITGTMSRRAPAQREGEQVEARHPDHRDTRGRRPWPWPVAMPTRRPVNRPGPTSTAMPPSSVELDLGLPGHELDHGRQGLGMAAAAALVRRREHALVAADGAPHLGGGGLDRQHQHLRRPPSRERPASPRTRGPGRPAAGRGAARSSARRRPAPQLEPHLEEVDAQHGGDGVAPLDQRDALAVDQLVQPQVLDLLELLEPVDVEVVDLDSPLVPVGEREGGAGDRIGRRPAPARSPGRTPSCRRPARPRAPGGRRGPRPRPRPRPRPGSRRRSGCRRRIMVAGAAGGAITSLARIDADRIPRTSPVTGTPAGPGGRPG